MRWLRNLLGSAEDPRRMRSTDAGDPELEAPGALLGRVESSLAELARARERAQATANQLRATGPDTRSLQAVQSRLEALVRQEREMRALRARLLCEQVDDAVERAQLRAEALKAQASVLLDLDDADGDLARGSA